MSIPANETPKPQPKTSSSELNEQELKTISGGATATASNIMKTKHDTVKNTISNIH